MTIPSNLLPVRISDLPPRSSFNDAYAFVPVAYNGVTYKVSLADIMNMNNVPSTRRVNAGVGLTGGGDLSADITLNIGNTGVTSGQYGDNTKVPVITVNDQGQIVDITEVSVSTSGLSAALPLAINGNNLMMTYSNSTPNSVVAKGGAAPGSSIYLARADHTHDIDISGGSF